MSNCDECGKSENMPYQCRHCGGTFCADHRLPENHDCAGLDDWGDPDGVFDSGFDDSVDAGGGRSSSVTDRLTRRLSVDTGPGGPLAYFRGNMTYVFLAVMWITFFLQFAIVPLLGVPIGSRGWAAIFVLQPSHPEYVWTWITSIFAHAGAGHIFVNSIVIFFFGRIVERYLGSKEFTVLFLVSGVVAGLSQIAIQIFQYVVMAGGSLATLGLLGGGVLGASGAGLAIMGVLTVLNPSLRVYIWFILPVPIWLLTAFYFVASVIGVIGPGAGLLGGNVADAAHLMGLVIGLVWGRRAKGRRRVPQQLQLGRGGGGPGGPRRPGGPGRGGFR